MLASIRDLKTFMTQRFDAPDQQFLDVNHKFDTQETQFNEIRDQFHRWNTNFATSTDEQGKGAHYQQPG